MSTKTMGSVTITTKNAKSYLMAIMREKQMQHLVIK